MFKITTEEPRWASDQAAALRQFLNGANGQILLQKLFWMRPRLADVPTVGAYDVQARLGAAERQAGYEEALKDLLYLTNSPETPSE